MFAFLLVLAGLWVARRVMGWHTVRPSGLRAAVGALAGGAMVVAGTVIVSVVVGAYAAVRLVTR